MPYTGAWPRAGAHVRGMNLGGSAACRGGRWHSPERRNPAHHPKLAYLRLGCPCSVGKGVMGQPWSQGWGRGFLEGSGGPAQPPSCHWAEEVEAAMSERLRQPRFGAIYHL